jgi:hypothetical protein
MLGAFAFGVVMLCLFANAVNLCSYLQAVYRKWCYPSFCGYVLMDVCFQDTEWRCFAKA